MTHKQVMYSLRKETNPTMVDYISLAIANGMQEVQVVENLSRMYEGKTGMKAWSRLSAIVQDYILRYSVTSDDNLVNYSKRNRPVIIEGVTYPSIQDACNVLGITRRTVECRLKNGKFQYA